MKTAIAASLLVLIGTAAHAEIMCSQHRGCWETGKTHLPHRWGDAAQHDDHQSAQWRQGFWQADPHPLCWTILLIFYSKQQEDEVKTAIVAMLLATTTVALIETPAAAGWCYEACGVQRPPPRQTRETVCTTVRRGNRTETVCTSS